MSTVEPLPTRPAVRFEEAAKLALANTQLRRNMGKATQTIRAKAPGGRRRSCPTGRPCARPAGRSRSATLRHLDTYLTRARGSRSSGPGRSVHWARDAAEASAIVTRIARPRTAPGRWSRSSR